MRKHRFGILVASLSVIALSRVYLDDMGFPQSFLFCWPEQEVT